MRGWAVKADRVALTAEWRLVHRVADAIEPSLVRAIQSSLTLPVNDTTWTRVIEQLKNGNAGMAAAKVDLDPLADALRDKVWPKIFSAYLRAAQIVTRNINRGDYKDDGHRLTKAEKKPKPKPIKSVRLGAIAFNETNPLAREFAERHSATLITNVTNETRDAVRVIIGEGFRNQIPPRELAKRIRLIVGLTERDALAVEHFRSRLKDTGLVTGVINRQVEFYAFKKRRDRSLLIARTEVMGASNAGQLDAWRQGQSSGLVDPDLVKEWIVTPDDELCPYCKELDGQQRSVDAAFSNGQHNPPAHPACRCASGLVPPRRDE